MSLSFCKKLIGPQNMSSAEFISLIVYSRGRAHDEKRYILSTY
jgi:hypothetical protein